MAITDRFGNVMWHSVCLGLPQHDSKVPSHGLGQERCSPHLCGQLQELQTKSLGISKQSPIARGPMPGLWLLGPKVWACVFMCQTEWSNPEQRKISCTVSLKATLETNRSDTFGRLFPLPSLCPHFLSLPWLVFDKFSPSCLRWPLTHAWLLSS